MRKSLLFIYNPFAGKREVEGRIHQIANKLTKNDFMVTLHPTQGNDDAFEVTSRYGEKYDYIVCAGGDGTLNEISNGLMTIEKNRPVLGYIPCGSTNDFATSSGIPTKLNEALENIIEGVPTCIDIGRLNNSHYFNYVAAFGLFTDLSYGTSQNMKNLFGHTAYVLEGMKRLTNIKSFRCELELEEQTIEDEFIFGAVTNSASVGGFKVPEGSFYEKDNFQLILLKYSQSLFDYQGIAAMLLGLKEPGEQFIIQPIEKVKFSSSDPIAWTVDGEFGGNYKETEISILKKEIEIILPKLDEEARAKKILF